MTGNGASMKTQRQQWLQLERASLTAFRSLCQYKQKYETKRALFHNKREWLVRFERLDI